MKNEVCEQQGDLFTGEFLDPPKLVADPALEDVEECEYCGSPATVKTTWYDIFSDESKGEICMCEDHYEEQIYFEGFFECVSCERLMINNYSWENYYILTEDGPVCLKCAFEKFIENPTNAITADNVDDVLIDIRTRKLKALAELAPHLIACGVTYHKDSLKFITNYDFTDFGGVEGLWVAFGNDIRLAIKEHGAVYLILDAAYQFNVSIGIYVSKREKQ